MVFSDNFEFVALRVEDTELLLGKKYHNKDKNVRDVQIMLFYL